MSEIVKRKSSVSCNYIIYKKTIINKCCYELVIKFEFCDRLTFEIKSNTKYLLYNSANMIYVKINPVYLSKKICLYI